MRRKGREREKCVCSFFAPVYFILGVTIEMFLSFFYFGRDGGRERERERARDGVKRRRRRQRLKEKSTERFLFIFGFFFLGLSLHSPLASFFPRKSHSPATTTKNGMKGRWRKKEKSRRKRREKSRKNIYSCFYFPLARQRFSSLSFIWVNFYLFLMLLTPARNKRQNATIRWKFGFVVEDPGGKRGKKTYTYHCSFSFSRLPRSVVAGAKREAGDGLHRRALHRGLSSHALVDDGGVGRRAQGLGQGLEDVSAARDLAGDRRRVEAVTLPEREVCRRGRQVFHDDGGAGEVSRGSGDACIGDGVGGLLSPPEEACLVFCFE